MGRGFWTDWRPGILAGEQIEKLFSNRVLLNGDENDIDHAALDLHLSDQCWQTHGSIKLKRGELLVNLLEQPSVTEQRINLSRKQLLQTGKTYIVKLREEIGKSARKLVLCGAATGKSTIGRLDVLTRLIVDGCEVYDWLPEVGKWPKGQKKLSIYVEITPITFPIKIKEGLSVNQLRLFWGHPDLCLLNEGDIPLYGRLMDTDQGDSHNLTLNLEPIVSRPQKAIAFTTKDHCFDSSKAINLSSGAEHEPRDYWEIVPANGHDYVKIENGRFYILRSQERFRLPKDVGVYCQAITENLGEIRIHYAGFVHPGFGYYRDDGRGTPLVFEVRGHTIDAFLRHGELMAKVSFYRTAKPVTFSDKEIAQMKNEDYHNQELQLSKYFKKWNS